MGFAELYQTDAAINPGNSGGPLLDLDGHVIDGQPVSDLETWTIYLETQKAIGDTVQMTVLRDGQEMVIPVVLAEQPTGR